MRVALALLWILTLVGAFAAGRLGGPDAELSSVSSFREALLARDELTRAQRMSAFLENLDPETLPAALEALEAHNAGVSRQEVRLFLLAWSRFDAPGAFAWSRAWKTRWRETLMTEAIYAWGFRDARAALRELDAMGDPAASARFRSSLFEGWLRSDDRAGASEAIAAIEDPRQRGRLLSILAGETMRDGPEALLGWADAVAPDAPNNFKTGAFNQAAAMVARADPQRTAEWYLLHREHPYSAGALKGIARAWAERHDPPALFDWLRKLPVETERADETGDAIAAGFRAWLRKDPEQAEAWLSAALPDPRLDPAIVELVRAEGAPRSAMEWAVRIQDEDLRRAQTVRVGRSWRARDPEALGVWLDQVELPDEISQEILATAPAAARARLDAKPPWARAPRR